MKKYGEALIMTKGMSDDKPMMYPICKKLWEKKELFLS